MGYVSFLEGTNTIPWDLCRYIYRSMNVFFSLMVNVGKYTFRPMDGMGYRVIPIKGVITRGNKFIRCYTIITWIRLPLTDSIPWDSPFCTTNLVPKIFLGVTTSLFPNHPTQPTTHIANRNERPRPLGVQRSWPRAEMWTVKIKPIRIS